VESSGGVEVLCSWGGGGVAGGGKEEAWMERDRRGCRSKGDWGGFESGIGILGVRAVSVGC